MANIKIAIPYIKESEGGLSRSQKDSARKNPAPFTYKGFNTWHTNKGVTWSTFLAFSKILGYQASATNFFTMPDDIWLKIYKYGYWDKIKGDSFKSDVIASAISDMAWIRGDGTARIKLINWINLEFKAGAKNYTDFVDFMNSQEEKILFPALVNFRKTDFLSINQPDNHEGWINRMNKLLAFGLDILKKKARFKRLFYNFPALRSWINGQPFIKIKKI
jgi:lysozyme family protein